MADIRYDQMVRCRSNAPLNEGRVDGLIQVLYSLISQGRNGDNGTFLRSFPHLSQGDSQGEWLGDRPGE